MIDSPSEQIVAQPIDLTALAEPRVIAELLEWYAELEAVAREINDRVSLLRAGDRIAELKAMQR